MCARFSSQIFSLPFALNFNLKQLRINVNFEQFMKLDSVQSEKVSTMSTSYSKQTKMMQISKGSIAPRVIVCGDQARALLFSMFLDKNSIVFKSSNLDYDTYTGTYNGVPVSIASHGVGVAGAQIAFQELIQCGASVIIRAGTCGSLVPQLQVGMMSIPHSFVRNEQVTANYLPINVPALCHYDVVLQLEEAAKKYKHPHLVGMGITIGIYEPYGGPLEDTTKFWKTCGCSSIEMESTSLCLLGYLSNVKVGAILTVDGYVFENIERERKLQSKESDIAQTSSTTSSLQNEEPELKQLAVYPSTSAEDDEKIRDWEYVVEFGGRAGLYSAGKILCPGIATMCRIALDAIVNVSI